jgi:hypothetical protein
LNYFAKDTDGISETPKSQAYIIETTPPTTTATPTGGTYYSPQTVTLSANEPATIYYTTDGTTPTTNSAVCSSPLTIFATTKLMYFAKDLVGHIETVKSQTYTIDTTPPITIATPVGGTYSPPLTVTLTASKPATIYYTTNSTIPTTSSTVYSGPLTISASTNLMYFGVDPGGNTGAVISQTYSTAYDPDSASIFQSKSGTYTHTFTSNATVTLSYLNGAGGSGGNWNDYEDGSPGGISAIVYDGVTIATANGGGGGDGYYDTNNGYPGTASNSIIGATNTTGGGNLGGLGLGSGGNGGNGGSVTGGTFSVLSGQTISVYLGGGGAYSYTSTGADASVSLSWNTTLPVTTATPAGGTYNLTQIVTLSANKPATIYYTTDGTTPTTSSAVYSAPLTISVNTTLHYFAKDQAGNIETVKTQAYTITPPVTTATPSGGTFYVIQTVTLSASKPATIYYTTNGTTPTTSSAVYSAPLTISSTTTLKYFSKDPAGNTEAINTQTYTITVIADSGSIVQSTPGTYTHTFTSNATVTLNYLKGAGGGGGDGYDWEDGSPGGTSTIVNNGVTLATANGGNNGDGTNDLNNGPPGTATNSITGATNTTGGGGLGGAGGRSGGNGGNGGSVTGGTFAVLSGQTISVILSGGGAGGGAQGGTGANASASLSWH